MAGLTVVTGWSPSGYIEYGKKFFEAFDKHWPEDVPLLAYVEEVVPELTSKRRPVRQILISEIPGCKDFLDRHSTSNRAHGRLPLETWKEKERIAGYSYRFDAYKFCKQAFIPLHAASLTTTGLMCWLDADVVTFSGVPARGIEELLPPGKDLAYLGRGEKHSEIGFQLYRLPGALGMLGKFASLYDTDEVFQLPEWHSAFVFDHARKTTGVAAHDLTPRGVGHVWFQSPLGNWMDHLKGKRKTLGISMERYHKLSVAERRRYL